MSIRIMSDVWADREIANHSELLILLALGDFSNDDGSCWPAIETIAFKARVTQRQVYKILKRLEDKGRLSVSHGVGPHGTNVYRILDGGMNSIQGERYSAEYEESKKEPSYSPKSSLTIRNHQEKETLPLLRSMDTGPDAERIYQLYPRKADRKTALNAIRRSLRLFGLELIESKTTAFAAACAAHQPDPTFIPYPATWFNKQRFNDESTWPQPPPPDAKAIAFQQRELARERRSQRETERAIAKIDACADRIEAENRRLA